MHLYCWTSTRSLWYIVYAFTTIIGPLQGPNRIEQAVLVELQVICHEVATDE